MSERVEQLLQAGNEASARVRNLWITFLLFGTYLAIAIGGTTHRQMLLDERLELPVLDTSLPLLDFYRIAPGLFLIFHFYLLVQLYLLANKLREFDSALIYPFVLEPAQKDLRTRTDNFLITQLLVGRQRVWLVCAFVWLAAVLTMVVAPVVLLLAFQIRFLPYHDVTTTWIQRSYLIADVALVWLLWPAIASKSGRFGGVVAGLFLTPLTGLWDVIRNMAGRLFGHLSERDYRAYVATAFAARSSFQNLINRLLWNLVSAVFVVILSAGTIGFSLLVATIPAEEIERWLLNHTLPEDKDEKNGEPRWWLAPPGLGAVTEEQMVACLSRPARKNAEAVAAWNNEDGWRWNWWAHGSHDNLPGNCGLGKVDFGEISADFGELSFDAAGHSVDLGKISFNLGDLSFTSFSPWFSKRPRGRPVPVESEPNHVWWPTAILFEGEPDRASSQVTSLFSRNLVLVDDLDLVTLDDEELEKADRTLVLRGRDLRFARFDRSDLRKADLLKAKLTGAVMLGTRLDNADLSGAEMQGANLSGAKMQGAILFGAGLWMAVAHGTYLEWADTRATNDEDPFADSDLLERKQAIDAWLDAIPEGSARDLASDRLDILRDPSRGPAGCRAWLCAQIPPPKDWNDTTETGLGDYLGALGCQAGNAPHVARGLLWRMEINEGQYRPILAAALLAPDCAGAKGLTEQELARVQAIAEAKSE